jgi:ligand-binding SRPBCC domain-containing protein
VLRLERQQFVPRPRDEVFAFFAEAQNLEMLTPAFLNFRILTPQPLDMRSGTLIDYRIRLGGIPMRWRTRIEMFDAPLRFVDVQLSGPYRYWHHLHEFQAAPGGTLVMDRVTYSLPFGFLGALAHWLFVRHALKRIFDYRQQRLAEVFPGG